MDAAAKQQRVDTLWALCRGRGLRVTRQRRLILEAVLDAATHPTADQVCEVADLRVELRGLCRRCRARQRKEEPA